MGVESWVSSTSRTSDPVVLSNLEVFARSQTVTYAVKVVISEKRCKTETFLLQTTNRK